jgi:glucokinase
MILAGDIGGTKTTLGLFAEGSAPGQPLDECVYNSQDHHSLEEITALFLAREDSLTVDTACFAVAGPVLGDTATLTNLPWIIKESNLSTTLGIGRTRLINDVQAFASSVPILGEHDLRTLNVGVPVTKGVIAVIAPGTGLGEAFLTWNGNSYMSHPSEGGHTDFAPANEHQTGLLKFLSTKCNHVSWELVCSGIGITNIYDYLESTGQYRGTALLSGNDGAYSDRTPAIIDAALEWDPSCPQCAGTLEMFISILGAEAGNLVLKTMATGGLYLGGGIPPRILKALGTGHFITAFNAKGRLTPMMEKVPVHVILNPRAALMGAAMEAIRMGSDGFY